MSAPRRPGRRLQEWAESQPGLSVRSRRLLLEGDVEGSYRARCDGDSGYRLTMALAVAVSQPGREWSPSQWYEALVLRPTGGGAWARGLRARKGDRYAEAKLTSMLAKARRFVAVRGTIRGRPDAAIELAGFRDAVERTPWQGTRGGMDEKNLTARLRRAERAGGLDHQVSVRQLAEEMGCAKSTAELSNRRLVEEGWLQCVQSGAGKNRGSRWRLSIPPEAAERCAAPGQWPAAEGRGAGGVPRMHAAGCDTRALASVMAHDAFHHFGHGTSGARLLSCLNPLDGTDAVTLARAAGLHRTTVRRRLTKLVDDGLVLELDGLYYLPPHLAAEERLRAEEAELRRAAEERGTDGLGERRRRRHAEQRSGYQRWLEDRQQRRAENRRAARPPLRLVPQGVVDPVTGELLDEAWRGWDTSDPTRPVWLDGAAGLERDVVLPACA